MVGYVAQPILVEEEAEEQEQDQDSKSKNPKPPIDPLDPSFPDFSFVDSLLDFDFMNDFLEDSDTVEKKIMEIGEKENSTQVEAPSVFELMVKEDEPLDLDSGIEKQASSVADVSELMVKGELLEVEREGNLGDLKSSIEPLEVERAGNLGDLNSSIEEKLGRFSLVGNDSSAHSAEEEFVLASELMDDEIVIAGTTAVAALASFVADNISGGGSSSSSGGDEDEEEDDSDSESGKESSSSASSSSDSSGDDAEEEEEDNNDEEEEEEARMQLNEAEVEEKEEEVRMQLNEEEEGGEMEEGEIRDVDGDEMDDNNDEKEEEEEEEEGGEKMVEWSDSEFVDVDEEEEEFGGVKGPIKSKNEVEVLPPVPPVEATLQPHHEMLPVGIVLSTLGAQVIVEGTEKHNPLNEGSILWITEKRSPLGIVDEIFGPVKNPYYVVRYNSETEVPAEVHQGSLISFVAEFAHHVLGEKNLYKKGYDASGEHDEELTDDGEFSDDEKEAEHKRMQKMSKRGLNQQTGNDSRRKNRNKNRNRNGNGNRNDHMPSGVGQQPPNHNQQNQQNASAAATSSMNNGASFFPPFRPMAPTNGNFQPPNGGWLNPMPSQQPNTPFIPGAFPGNNMPWLTQNQPFQQPFNLNQGSVPNGVFPGGQGLVPNGVFSGGQMNLFGNGPSPWPAMTAQNCINQALLGMGFQMQQPNLPMMNLGGQQGMMCNPNQPQVQQQNCNMEPPQMAASGDIRPPQQFNSGASSGRGNRPYQRGGRSGRGRGRGRFSGGRGR